MQQSRLVAGVRQMYERLESCGGWEGPRLQKTAQGVYSVNEILVGLGIMPTDLPLSAWTYMHNGLRIEMVNHDDGDEPSPDTNSSLGTNSALSPKLPDNQEIGIGRADKSNERAEVLSPIDLRSFSPSDLWNIPLEDYSEVDRLVDADLLYDTAAMQIDITSEQVAQYFLNLC